MPAWRAQSRPCAVRHFKPPTPPWRLRLALLSTMALLLALALAGGALSSAQLATLAVFGAAMIGWVLLRLDETPLAIAAALALVALQVLPVERVYAALGQPIVWLLIGAFVLAAALQASGLVERLTLHALAGARSTMGLLHRVAWAVAATAFVVPSTSGRAALLLPVFLVLARTLGQPRLTRALALLFPSVILLSAGASLLGAGAHLVAVEFIAGLGATAPGFLHWALLALPFAAASTWLATVVIGWLFLQPDERRAAVALPPPPQAPMTSTQRRMAALTGATVAGFALGSSVGLDPALVALVAALAATHRPFSGIDLKTALKKVEWNLVLFMAATLVLGQALLDSGAAARLASAAAQALGPLSAPLALMLAVLAALGSHLLITSRTARALVLIPTVALPLAASGLNPVALVMVVVLGSGFCQTLAISAKPVTLFAATEVPTYNEGDLLRLSLWLLAPLAAALALCAALWWPLLGLALRA